MNIVPLDRQAAPALLALWEASVRATHTFLKEKDILFFKHYLPAAFQEIPQLLGAFMESTGHSKEQTVPDTKSLVAFMGIDGEMLEMLFVHPEYFGQGIGSALIHCALKDFHVKRVDVNESNTQAYSFYQKHGFVCIGRSPLDGTGKPFPLLHLHYANKFF